MKKNTSCSLEITTNSKRPVINCYICLTNFYNGSKMFQNGAYFFETVKLADFY